MVTIAVEDGATHIFNELLREGETTKNIFKKSQTDPMIMIAEKDGAMIFLTTDPKLIL